MTSPDHRTRSSFRAALRCAAVLSFLALAAPLSAGADVRLEAGGGALVPFGRDQRGIYGTSSAFLVGISSAFGDNGSRFFLDVGHVRGSGDELPPDPTFEGIGRAKFRLWPVALGARFDLNRNPEQNLRLFLGIGARTVFTHWEGVTADGSAPTAGAFVEWRPEYRIGARWTVWARQRLDLLGDVEYGTDASVLNYSGTTLELGFSFGLDDAPLTPPREQS